MGTINKQIGDILVIQPALEPWPSRIWKFRRWAAFFYVRWSTIGFAVEFLTAGVAIIVGPLMLGICHIERQLAATPPPQP